MPVDIMLGTTSSTETTLPQYVTRLRTILKTMYEHVRNHMEQKQAEQKLRYDARSQGKPFTIGDLVWLHSPAVPRGKSRKLHRPWTGPFRIIAKPSDPNYRLQHVQFRRRRPVEFLDAEIDSLIESGCVVPSSSCPMVCSPLLVVCNAKGKKCLVIDLRYVNNLLLKQEFRY